MHKTVSSGILLTSFAYFLFSLQGMLQHNGKGAPLGRPDPDCVELLADPQVTDPMIKAQRLAQRKPIRP